MYKENKIEIEKELLDFISKNFAVARNKKITSEDYLLQSGIIDSLGVMQIVNFIMEEKNIELDEDDLLPENFESVNKIAELIVKRM